VHPGVVEAADAPGAADAVVVVAEEDAVKQQLKPKTKTT
jgi:hypothetical protein